MLGVTHYETGGAEETQYYLRWPERGGVKTVIELLFVSYLVTVATPILAAEIAIVYPAIVPEPFTTAVYGMLWLAIIGVLVSLFRSDSLIVTHRFDERAAVEYRVECEAPDDRWAPRHGGLLAVGGTLCWVTFDRFMATFVEVLDLLVVVVDEFQLAVTPLDGLAVVGFLVGLLAFSTGADRLFVDGLRWYIRRQQDEE